MKHTDLTLRTADEIVAAGLVSPQQHAGITQVAARYAVAITPAMARLIDANDLDDPIALQFIPDVRELHHHPAELADPIGDGAKSPVPGIVHRNPDRVLFKIANVCPVYCRFCFRREMVGPGKSEALSTEDIASALDYIRTHPEIWEVILTGGDPLILSPRRISEITAALGTIPHVKVLRWHTRVPVVAPERITDDLVAAMTQTGKTTFVAVHTNHLRELTAEARAACAKLVDAGIPLVSQTVLLRGVNDTVEALEDLMRALVETRIKPYYLHHGDLAPGTSHFRTTIAEGQELMRQLRQRLSGLALPSYVLDIPGAHGKVPAENAHVVATSRRYHVSDPGGAVHIYEDCCALPGHAKT